MKRIYLLPIFLLSIFVLNSCSTPEDDDLGLDTSPNTFVANLEGEAWNAAKKEAVLSNNFLTIYAESNNHSLVCLQMELYKNEPVGKSYVLTNTSTHFASYDFSSRLDSLVYWTKNNPDQYGQSGDIELTKLDETNKLVSGTFKFRAFNNHNSSDYQYFSQGAFTDIRIVDSLSIDVMGLNEN